MNQLARAFAFLIFAASVTVMPAVARQHYLPQGAHTDIYALQFAARPGNSLEFRRLITDHPNLLSLIEPNGTTMLQWALANNNYDTFQHLLKAGANPNLADRTGNTPLHVAAQINKPWHALELLQAGADPMARNAQGQTFQRYLFMPNDNMVTRTIRKGRQAVREYLSINGVPVEVSAP